MSNILSDISTLIIEGNFGDMVGKTNAALEEGLGADEILNKGLMPGMDHVGVEFKAGNMFVPEVLRSAKAMQEAMNIIRPILAETGIETTGKILIGTVKGDLHDIGKNLVGMMCEGAGFEIIDLGKEQAQIRLGFPVRDVVPVRLDESPVDQAVTRRDIPGA